MSIDYEREYDNRRRVPEHPEIFARWQRDSAAYRTHPGAALGIPYGSSPRQFVDVFPAGPASDAPLAMFIHGGYWRSLDPTVFSHMAGGLNAHGVDVAMAGYDLCPQVGIGDIVEQMRNACLFLWKRHGKRVMVFGHSAGGHLAACMLATDWKTLGAPDKLVGAAYSISGLFDLSALINTSMNNDFKLDEAEANRLSPLFWKVPAGLPFDAVVGGAESSEFRRQTKAIADAWGARHEEIAGANHFTVLDPLTDANGAMVTRLAELARLPASA